MPKLSVKIPQYRRHSSRDLAFVVLGGRRVYLPGGYGSKESRADYKRLVVEWQLQGRPTVPPPETIELTIAELLVAYWKHAQVHYVKNGRQTDELACIKAALRPMRELFANLPAAEFGPKRLALVQQRLIDGGGARGVINKHVGRIRRLFRWATSQELVSVTVHQSLATLPGLQRGRTKARETEPILPVDVAIMDATLPHLPPTVADMVRLQLATGMRPAEVCLLRPCDLDRIADVWRYVPHEHKTEHRGRQRIIFVGPQAQAVLLPYLLRPTDAYCFSPQEAEAKRRSVAYEARVTPIGYGNAPGTNKKRHPKRPPSDRYDVPSYRRAICRACELAFGMPKELRKVSPKLPTTERERLSRLANEWRAQHVWAPNQLRHAAATRIRAQFGLEAAQNVLGHSTPDTTLIYAERSEKLAADVARQVG